MDDNTFEEFERRAEAGDGDAQYALAAIFAQRKLVDRANLWLQRAADQGHADALYTIAGRLLSVTEGAVEYRADAVTGLQKARERGSVAALRTLAALSAAGLLGEGGWPGALAMMREACERGEGAALREMATLVLDIDEHDDDGAALLGEAAKSDALAAALASRRAHRNLQVKEKSFSLDRAFEKVARGNADPEREEISAAPRIAAFRAAFGHDLCDHLIGAALPRLKREQVLGADGQRRTDMHRTAWGALLGFGFADLPSVSAGQKMARLARIPYSHGEPLSILRYVPGQEYRPHHDFLGPNDPDLGAHGQRLKTALLYLNEGYVGGATHFLAPAISFVGNRGDILIFDNVDENGALDYSVRHEGQKIERGEKWIASLWLRDRPFSG